MEKICALCTGCGRNDAGQWNRCDASYYSILAHLRGMRLQSKEQVNPDITGTDVHHPSVLPSTFHLVLQQRDMLSHAGFCFETLSEASKRLIQFAQAPQLAGSEFQNTYFAATCALKEHAAELVARKSVGSMVDGNNVESVAGQTKLRRILLGNHRKYRKYSSGRAEHMHRALRETS